MLEFGISRPLSSGISPKVFWYESGERSKAFLVGITGDTWAYLRDESAECLLAFEVKCIPKINPWLDVTAVSEIRISDRFGSETRHIVLFVVIS